MNAWTSFDIRGKRKGLTILEIILSVAIVAISAIVILQVFVAAHGLNDRTNDLDQAIFEAVNFIEQVDDSEADRLFDTISDTEYVRGLDFAKGFELRFSEGEMSGRRMTDSGLELVFSARIEEGVLHMTVNVYRDGGRIYFLDRLMYRKEVSS